MRINASLIFGILFALLGLIAIVMSNFIYGSYASFKRTAVETTASIVKIDREYTTTEEGFTDIDYTVHINFEVNDGVEHTVTISDYNHDMYEGKQINIYYNPNNLKEIRLKGEGTFGLILLISGLPLLIIGVLCIMSAMGKKLPFDKLSVFGAVGIVFVIVGVVALASGIYSAYSFSKFKETAEEGTALITEIECIKTGTRRSGSNKRKREIEYTYFVHIDYEANGSPYSQIMHEYSSYYMSEGKQIKIYYNSNNPYEVRWGNTTDIGSIGALVLGSVFVIIGTVFVIIEINRFKRM